MIESQKPLIAIVGATSKQGRSVVMSLLQSQRFRVRALTRDDESPTAHGLRKLGAEIRKVAVETSEKREIVDAFEGATGAFLMTPPIAPPARTEVPLGRALADAAVTAGVQQIVFSTLENVEKITGGKKYAPHFTDKAVIADYIRGLPVTYSFIMLGFFYTNLLEYYVPRYEQDRLLLPIYLPEDFSAPFVDPLTATGPAVLEIFSNPSLYAGKTLPIVGDVISPGEMVDTFERVTGLKAEYRNAFTREGLLQNFPGFAANEHLVLELLGMVEYAVEYGYFAQDRDIGWSRRLNPGTSSWETFLRTTGWRGDQQSFRN
jgi:uncharacterized protein YbjT (DUF2867 family)